MESSVALIRQPNNDLPAPSTATAAREALALLLEDTRSEATRKAYRGDLADFFRWWTGGVPTEPGAAALCSQDAGSLAILLNRYKAHLRERGLSESTVNRRLAALRSLLRLA